MAFRPFQNLFKEGTNNRFFVRDFRNATHLRVDINPPRQKPQGYINFVFNRELWQLIEGGTGNFNQQISSLVRTADLPSVSFKTDTKNQYNRKRIVHTGVDFPAINVKVIDTVGNEWLTIFMKYYSYLYMNPRNKNKSVDRDATVIADGANMVNSEFGDKGSNDGVPDFGKFDSNLFGFNLQNSARFFERIDLILYHGNKGVQYSLQNPVLTSFKPGQINYADGDIQEFDLTFEYENFTVYDKLNFDLSATDLARFEQVGELPLWVDSNKPLSITSGSNLDLQFLGNSTNLEPFAPVQVRAGQISSQAAATTTQTELLPTYTGAGVADSSATSVDLLKDPAGFVLNVAKTVVDASIATAIHGGNIKDVAIQVATGTMIQGITTTANAIIEPGTVLARIRGE